MHELGSFSCLNAFGATPRPAPAYPCAHSCIFGPCGSHYESMKKGGQNRGQLQAGRPLGRPTQWWCSSIRASAQGAHGTPSAQFYQFHSEFLLPLLSLLLFLPKFIRKRRKRFPSFAFSFASHLHLVFTFFSSQERVCGGTTTPQERFCGASSPTRTILWSVITHKNDFCERQPCPTRTTNSRTADLIFTNSHIILPSV